MKKLKNNKKLYNILQQIKTKLKKGLAPGPTPGPRPQATGPKNQHFCFIYDLWFDFVHILIICLILYLISSCFDYLFDSSFD